MNSIIFTILLISANPSFEAQMLDGRTLTGSLEELTADRFTIATKQGKTSLETEELLRLFPQQKQTTKPAPCDPKVVVELTDGSIIQGLQYVARGGRASITLVGGKVVEAPASAVQTVRLRGSRETRLQQESAAISSEWSRLTDMKADGDLLIVRTDDALDYHQGVLHDVTEEVIHFDLDGEILPVKQAKVFGIVYRHGTLTELPAAVCRITDSAGSEWSVQSLALAEERLQWTTPTGFGVSQPLKNVAQIDFSAGKLVYLSDLEPESVLWTPYFAAEKPLAVVERFYAPRFDRGFDDGALQLDGTPYPKGLAICGRTELVYRLPGPFGRFRAVVGIDDAGQPGGKVRLVVRGDDKLLLEATIADGDAPHTIDLDLTGARRLTILVDFDDSRLGSGDRLLLCNARIMK